MRVSIWKVIPVGLLLLSIPGFASVHPKTGSSRRHIHASVREVSARHSRSFHLRGRHEEFRGRHEELRGRHEGRAPIAMPAERATQIQTALIKQGYLSGEPSGTWDSQTVAAMQKLQGDNGWQTKITPDSRALIKLGLGPHDGDAAASDGGGAVSVASKNAGQDPTPTAPQ
jgi:Putative peptidoglycan binding domain